MSDVVSVLPVCRSLRCRVQPSGAGHDQVRRRTALVGDFRSPPQCRRLFQNRCRQSILLTEAWSCWAAADLRRRASVASAAAGRAGDGDDDADGATEHDEVVAEVQLAVLDIASRSTLTTARQRNARDDSPCTAHSATRDVASPAADLDIQSPNQLRLQQTPYVAL